MQATTEARYLDYNEAAKYMSLSRFTLTRKVRAGELRIIKIGSAARFDVRDLDQFMQSRKS